VFERVLKGLTGVLTGFNGIRVLKGFNGEFNGF
jgi:hypothetical protein